MAILLLLLVATLAPGLAAPTGQPPRAEEAAVSGYVLTPEGTPVSEGTVVAQAGTTRTTVSIDRTGRFRLITTRPGPHQIVVSVPGLSLYRVDVTVPASRAVRRSDVPGRRTFRGALGQWNRRDTPHPRRPRDVPRHLAVRAREEHANFGVA